jgi:cytoskeletal protein RodZ
MSNFGSTFKKAREATGLSLDKIAAETRISTRFLLAIEDEAFHQLPGGIFNRGFIRAYAELLHLDSEQALADYDRIFATTEAPLDVLRNVERASSRRSERHLYPIAGAILIVLIGAYYVFTHYSATSTEEPAPPPVIVQQPSQPENSTTPPIESLPITASDAVAATMTP